MSKTQEMIERMKQQLDDDNCEAKPPLSPVNGSLPSEPTVNAIFHPRFCRDCKHISRGPGKPKCNVCHIPPELDLVEGVMTPGRSLLCETARMEIWQCKKVGLLYEPKAENK